MGNLVTDGMYLFFSIPLGLASLLENVIAGTQGDPNTPQVSAPAASRQWFSQPRPCSDPTIEVITVNFKSPLSVSEIGWDALRVSSHTEVWYLDRQNNWRPVLDESRIPVALNMSTSSATAWYKAHFFCYPIVAKSLQFRINRINDPLMGNQPYCVGIKNALIRRNIYTRSDGTQGIEPQQDILGNTFTSYIKDWDASKAFDDDPHTYWKSMPLPDPNAVASLYLDCRDSGGNPQLIDTLYMDPVYAGQALNLYYTNDDTQGTLKLSPVSAVPTTDENTRWQLGKGRWDDSIDPGTSNYQFPMNWGPLVSQDTWIGIEWQPDFAAAAGPSANPILFQVTPTAPDGTQWWPTIFYDVGAGEIVLELTNGVATPKTYRVPFSPVLVQYQTYRIVVGWGYAPKTVFISVKTPNGGEVAHLSTADSALPTLMTLDGSIGFQDFRGLLTADVIKLENWSVGQTSFQSNPQVYVSPDPVIPDPSGNIPATTLDNAIFAAAWAYQEMGTGGDHESRYEQKTWTPIWQNYFSQKGKMFFPSQLNLKYIKMEFTILTEEPYPVYDSGIQISYKIFPVSVTSTVSTPHPGLLGTAIGLLAVGADVILGGLSGVNFLNPATINNAVNSVFGQVISPVNVTAGIGTINTTSLPNTSTLDVFAQQRQEVSSPYVYRRTQTNASTLAGQMINVATSGGGNPAQGISSSVGEVVGAIADSFSPLLNFAANPAGLPSQGQDWWIFPGATLRMPAVIMNGLTAITQTILGRPNTITRQRFDTTSVHRYDIKTVTRDAAVAYFAGVREVQPYVTTYIASQDPPTFAFSSYSPSQWVLTNMFALDSGPVTTAAAMNPEAIPAIAGISTTALLNGNFDGDLANWTQSTGVWTYDGTKGHFANGSAKVIPAGAAVQLLSNAIDVVPGIHYDASVWVQWSGLTATAGSEAIQLQAKYYNSSATLLSTQTVGITNATWPAATPTVAGNNWTQIVAAASGGTGFTTPASASTMRLALVVTSAVTAGTVWFDTVLTGTTDSVEGTAFKDFLTTSTFSKVKCTFSDSGVVRSDDMWAQQDPLDTNISSTALAFYTTTIPDVIPSGMWGDTFATWGDATIDWGAPRAVVAINVDPDRLFDNKRVLHFTRAGGAEEAGVKVRQITNFVSNGLFRIGAVFFKPTANTNQVTLRLRRVSDGVYIYQESFSPVTGYWFEKVTDFQEIPDSEDQEYTVELVLTGDNPDEFYLNDLYVEIAGIRYFVRLGDSSQFLHDVTQLRYADSAIVSTTVPVNEFSVEVAILSPKFYAYGMTATPVYLK